MHKIAVMGDRDSIYGFAALGMEPFPVTERETAVRTLHQLCEGGYAVIYMTEKLGEMLDRELQHYRSQGLPAIILIPGVSGNTGNGMNAVRQSVLRAVGSDILGDKK